MVILTSLQSRANPQGLVQFTTVQIRKLMLSSIICLRMQSQLSIRSKKGRGTNLNPSLTQYLFKPQFVFSNYQHLGCFQYFIIINMVQNRFQFTTFSVLTQITGTKCWICFVTLLVLEIYNPMESLQQKICGYVYFTSGLQALFIIKFD